MARSDDRFRKTYNSMLAAFGDMEPGDQLPAELALAEQNDVSRTIVRSALARLNAAGIVAWNGRKKELLRLPTEKDHLPDPEEPINTTTSPRFAVRSIPFRTSSGPKLLWIFFNSITGLSVMRTC